MDEKIDASKEGVSRSDYQGDLILSSLNSDPSVNEEFQHLVERVRECRLCPRMEGRTRVLGLGNGPLDTQLLFIAEAPGRLGAERSGIPLAGDQTGRNFEVLLKEGNIDRRSAFITNAVLCNPQNTQGNNAPPASYEIAHCSDHLRATIHLLQPRFIVTLGQVALRALQHIETHTLTLAQDTGVPTMWYNRWLIALYHPGPRARIHRPLEVQVDDFRRLGAFISSDKSS